MKKVLLVSEYLNPPFDEGIKKTVYNLYISALDQIKMAFFEVRDEYSNGKFGGDYKDLEEEEQKTVKDAVPIIISLAEPEQIK